MNTNTTQIDNYNLTISSTAPTALIVCGMHRSGTSALTKALSICGFELPQNLMKPAQDNEEGFWESSSITTFNEELLTTNNSSWDDVFAFSETTAKNLNFPKATYEAAYKLLLSEFPPNQPIVLKDPRISLLTSFWHQVLLKAGYSPHYLIAVRNPIEVTRSLSKRNSFPSSKSYLLWLSYNLSVEYATRDFSRSFIHYEDLLDDWRNVFKNVEYETKLTLNWSSPHIQNQIERALNVDLRHHLANATAVIERQDVPDWVKPIYKNLLNNEQDFASNEDILQAKAEYLATREKLGPIVSDLQALLSSTSKQLSSQNQSLTQQIIQLRDSYEDELARNHTELTKTQNDFVELQSIHENTKTTLQSEIDSSLTELKKTQNDFVELQSLHENTKTTLQNEIDSSLTELKKTQNDFVELQSLHENTKTTLQNEIDSSLTKLKKTEAQAEELETALEQEKQSHATSIKLLDNKVLSIRDAYENQIKQTESLLTSTQNELSDIKNLYSSFELSIEAERAHAKKVILELETDLQREQGNSLERHRASARLSTELNAIKSSTAWRITSPARKAGAALPLFSSFVRRLLKLIWWTLTLQLPSKLRSSNERVLKTPPVQNSTSVKQDKTVPNEPRVHSSDTLPNSQIQSSPLQKEEDSIKWQGFDPSPIAKFLDDVHGHDDAKKIWIEHCKNFPLPYNPDEMDKPKLNFSDENAKEWIDRARAVGSHLKELGHEQPDVSIVVPVFNQLPFTLSSIASVYSQESKYTFEIILADDASTDQTSWLETGSLPRMKVVRGDKNLGFLGNCNNAAKQANGRYIAFLNNDTIALPGWLKNIVETLESDQSIGMVGSQLIFPHARIQEAGGIVWQDASAWNFGRGEDPRDPKYAFARDADYCSGASIILSKALWNDLDGFDGKQYEMAYYEDTDLAFRVRSAGYRVRYQPQSALIHFEGASSGMDLTQGQKKHQVSNLDAFYRRWKNTLKTHKPNGQKPEFESNRIAQKRILIIDAVTPTPDRDAGSVVTMEMIRLYQSQGYQVSFIPEDNFAYLPEVSKPMLAEGVEIFHWPFYKSVDEVLEREGHRFDTILAFRVTTAVKHFETIKKRTPDAKLFFHVADLHHLREQREAELKNDSELLKKSKKTYQSECNAVNTADLTIVHSSFEKEVLAKATPNAKVYVFPWISEPTPSSSTISQREGVLFIGGFRHPPNAQGLLWFLNEVWPIVRQNNSDAKLNVIGPDAPTEIMDHHMRNGVNIIGWVPKLEPYLDRTRITVAPLLFGAGVKGKVVSSMSAGVPVVGTNIAAEGLAIQNGLDMMVEDDAFAFAQSILKTLSDDNLWSTLSQGGLDYVKRELSRERGQRRIQEMDELVGSP